MATTAQDIVDQAVQRSALNNPDLVPNAQALKYISSFQRKIYVDASRVNPDFFGKDDDTASRVDGDTAWDLAVSPGDVGAVSLAVIKTITGTISGIAVGDPVNLISRRFPQIELAPRAFIRGRKLMDYNDELGTGAVNFVDTLTVFYSEMAPEVTLMSQALLLPDEWSDLVILPLARVFAIRDRRADEAQVINQEFNFVYESFIAHAGTYDHGANRPLVAISAAGPPLRGGGGGQ